MEHFPYVLLKKEEKLYFWNVLDNQLSNDISFRGGLKSTILGLLDTQMVGETCQMCALLIDYYDVALESGPQIMVKTFSFEKFLT